MRVLVLKAELHLPASQSLKAKRSIITPIVRHVDRLTGAGAAEVDFQDKWQRTSLGFSVVGESASVIQLTMDEIERYVWSRPDVEVLDMTRSWWEED